MNLANDPWIPVILQDKTSATVSLRDIFTRGETIADLAANPCQRIALMRLLICVAQAALDGPADEAEWRDCRKRLAPAALAYLDQWQHRFNLFGEHAFLQVDGLTPTPNSLADKIDLTRAAGNNPTIFDHSATPIGRVPQSATLAMNLLVYQLYSPGGLIGIAQWEGVDTEKTSEHAPCLEGSMLHTFLRGRTVIDSVHLNLLTLAQVDSLPNMAWGCPNWELETYSKQALDENASTYLGRLVPFTRAICCFADNPKMVLAAGIRYAKHPIHREPAATIVEFGFGSTRHPGYLSVDPGKHPWRELHAILALQQADKMGGALCLAHIRSIDGPVFDVWAGGLAADKAKLVDMAEWNMTLPVDLVDTTVLGRYENGVSLANQGCAALVKSVKCYAAAQNSDPIWRGEAVQLYWSLLDRESRCLVTSALEDDKAMDAHWVPEIDMALRTAYAQTCPHATPRQIQAYARGLKIVEDWKRRRAK